MISVLFVDDEPSLLDVTRLYLENTGAFSVKTSESAREGLELLKTGEFDVVVSDFQMPGMNGIEFLKVLRKEYPTLPFIIFTGKGREEIVIEAFEAGADFYLQKGGAPKPQFAELARKITSVVEHRRSVAHAFTLNRLYSALSATNHAIIHYRDVTELLDEICRIATEIGGFRMVWAGVLNEKSQRIEPVATCGHIDGYFDRHEIPATDIPSGRGPTGTAFREGKHCVVNDLSNDPMMAPWRDEALSRGYHSVAAFPFALHTRYAGTLTLYAPETDFFNDQIVRLLDEMTADITFALKLLAAEATLRENYEQLKNHEKVLSASETRYRELFDRVGTGVLVCEAEDGGKNFIVREINTAGEQLCFVDRSTAIGSDILTVFPGMQDAGVVDVFRNVLRTGKAEDLPAPAGDCEPVHREFANRVYRLPSGELVALFEDPNFCPKGKT